MFENQIRVTDNLDEQADIGKSLYEIKKDHYSHQVENYILDALHLKEKKDAFYISIYNYWVYGVSAKEYAFYRFNELNHEEKKKYITYRSRFAYYNQMNDISNAYLLNNKYETFKLFREYYRRDMVLLEDEQDYSKFQDFVSKHQSFVFKPICMGLGAGVQYIDLAHTDDKEKVFKRLLRNGKIIKNMHQWSGWETTDSIVLEEIIKQDQRLSELHPYSVTIVRLPSIAVKDGVHFFHPYIKVGRSENFINDERTGAIICGIDATNGIVYTDGYDEDGFIYKEHPDTKIIFKGFSLPQWKELLDLTRVLARTLETKGIRYVGWDFALSDSGWCIVEGNYDGEFLGQLPCQEGHADELNELIGYKPKNFWWDK